MMASDQASIERYTGLGWWGTDTLDAHFLRNVQAHPDRLAITDPPDRRALIGTEPQSLTYSELNDRVNAQVAALHEAGVRREHIVVFQLPNIHEIAVILLACSRMGAIASPVVMQYDRAELSEIFSQLNPAAYITV
ncbi:MAG: AMP-binding protein, partial [Halieaceae bacterium]